MRRPASWSVLVVLASAAGLFLGWRAWAARDAWERERPALPPAAGMRAPGLDTQLAACVARLAAYPPDEGALEEYALLCHANGQLEAASGAYRSLVRLQPREGRWPYLWAVIEAGYGRLDEATRLLREATRLAPDHVPGWLRLGVALLKADDITAANSAYEEALQRAPENAYALLGLARCALAGERWTAARGLLQRAAAADPRMGPAFHLLSTVHERLGNHEAAEAALTRADAATMEVEPPDPWIDNMYRSCYDIYRLRVVAAAALAGGNPDRALDVCERARMLAPDDARVYWQFGRIYLRVGRFSEARQALERSIELDPADDKAQLDLINLLQQQGDRAAALTRQAEYDRRFGGPPP